MSRRITASPSSWQRPGSWRHSQLQRQPAPTTRRSLLAGVGGQTTEDERSGRDEVRDQRVPDPRGIGWIGDNRRGKARDEVDDDSL